MIPSYIEDTFFAIALPYFLSVGVLFLSYDLETAIRNLTKQ